MSAENGEKPGIHQAGRDRPELLRVIGYGDYVSIGFGVMIGVGWVVYAGQWVHDGGVLGSVLAFVIGGLFFLPIGKCYAELTAALPVSGGEVAFSYKAFGPLMSFVTAWALSLGYMAVIPFETIAVGAMAEAIFPSLVTAPLYEIDGYRISLSGIVPGVLSGIWVIWLNWHGVRDMARFQKLVIYGLLLCTLVFTVIAFSKGDVRNLQPLFAGEGAWWAIAPASIASVIVVVPFFLAGFDCIPQAAEEAGVKMSPRQLGTAIVTCLVIGVVFYVLVILALGYSAPASVLDGIITDKDKLPMAEVFRHSFGYEWAAKLVLVAALLGIISTLNGMFMAATRLLFAQGRGGLLPRWFAVLHPEHKTPVNAVMFVGVLALLGPFIGKAGLGPIVSSSSLSFSVTLLITGIATLRLRQLYPTLERPYRIRTGTIGAAIIVSLILVGLMVVPGSPGQMGTLEFVVISLWMLIGLACHAVHTRNNPINPDNQKNLILGNYQ